VQEQIFRFFYFILSNPNAFGTFRATYPLKVDSDEKKGGGQEGDSNSASVWHFERVVSH
jgi:hypothetical protein